MYNPCKWNVGIYEGEEAPSFHDPEKCPTCKCAISRANSPARVSEKNETMHINMYVYKSIYINDNGKQCGSDVLERD